MNKANINRLKVQIDNKDGIIQRFLAVKFEVSQPYISHTINTKTSREYRKKNKIPKRTGAQKAATHPKCDRLAQNFAKKEVAIKDESYFRLNNCELSANAVFYTSDIDKRQWT